MLKETTWYWSRLMVCQTNYLVVVTEPVYSIPSYWNIATIMHTLLLLFQESNTCFILHRKHGIWVNVWCVNCKFPNTKKSQMCAGVFYEELQINIQHGFKMCNSSILLHDVSLKVSTLYTDTVLLEWAVRLKTSRNFS